MHRLVLIVFYFSLCLCGACRRHVEQNSLPLENTTRLQEQIADQFQAEEYENAEELAKKLLLTQQQRYGMAAPETVGTLNTLAEISKATGRFAKAELFYLKALLIHEHSLHTASSAVSTELNDISTAHPDQNVPIDALDVSKRMRLPNEGNQVIVPESESVPNREKHPAIFKSTGITAECSNSSMANRDNVPITNQSFAIIDKSGHDKKQHRIPLTMRSNPQDGETDHTLPPESKSKDKPADTDIHIDTCRHGLPRIKVKSEQSFVTSGRKSTEEIWPATENIEELETRYTRTVHILGTEHPTSVATVRKLADMYTAVGHYNKACPLYEQLSQIEEKKSGKNHPATEKAFDSLSFTLLEAGNYVKAEAVTEHTLTIDLQTFGSSHPKTAASLNRLGTIFQSTGRIAEATSAYQKSAAINQKALGRNHPDTATSLNHLAGIYKATGCFGKAEAILKQTSKIHETTLGPDNAETLSSLSNLGTLYCETNRATEAEPLLTRVLLSREKILSPDHPDIARALNNLADVYAIQQRHREAEELYQQALHINMQVLGPTHPETARTLNNLARLCCTQKRYAKAEQYCRQALEIALQINNPEILYHVQATCSELFAGTDRNEAAIFFAKQAVNTIQTLRGNVAALGKETLRTYDTTVVGVYRRLARLLVDQGRLPEAERVMELLKEQEYAQYTTRSAGAEDMFSGQAPLTAYESDRQQELDAASASLATLQAQRCRKSALRKIKNRTPEEEAEYKRLGQELDAASKQFAAVLDRVCASFGEGGQSREAEDLREAVGIQADLADLGPGTVAVHTIVSQDELTLMLITPRFRRAYTVSVDRGTLSTRISAFRAVLKRDHTGKLHDPIPLAREMYDLLFKPMQADLNACGARTILWHLDGPLRYLPPAALHDGSNYLIRRYCNTLYTSASKARLKDHPRTPWQGLGLGLTKARTIEGKHFDALSGVQAEIGGVIRDAEHQNGTVPGEAYLNEEFTWDLFKDSLEEKGLFPLVHVASHFYLHPGDDSHSFLVLGDGSPLTLRQVKEQNNLFGGVDLLTLSACETAFGGDKNEDGNEVDALSILAQRQGAKAVLATLWPVADDSTAQLMQEFYRLREASHLTKGEALRQAQLGLLGQTALDPGNQAPRGTVFNTGKKTRERAAIFTASADTPYAHPYYWAPFILMGNWK